MLRDVFVLVGAGGIFVAAAAVCFALARRLLMRLVPLVAFTAALTVLGKVINVTALWVTGLIDNVPVLAGTVIFTGAVSAGFALLAVRDLHHDLSVLEDAAARIAEGELSTQVPLKGHSELSRLERAFNEMADALGEVERRKEALERDRRQFFTMVSHDLRTPATALVTLAEALGDPAFQDPARTVRYQRAIIRHARALSALIEDLFELARLEQPGMQLAFETVAPWEIIEEAVDAFRLEADQRGLALRLEQKSELRPTRIDAARVQRVLYNLLRNAMDHTPTGGSIVVSVDGDDTWTIVSVADTGTGIPPDLVPLVFDRAVNVDRDPRLGLGLIIAKAIVEAHGGRIDAESDPEDGTRVTFTLPDVDPADGDERTTEVAER